MSMASSLLNISDMHGVEPAGRISGFLLVGGKLRHREMEM